MSSSDRRTFLLSLTALGALAGCGLRPVYGTGSPGRALRGNISVGTPDSREAFRLRSRIEDRLGPPDDPAYELEVTLQIARQEVGISTGQEITRYTLRGTAGYLLTEAATGAVVTDGEVSSFTGYSATGTSVATLAAERDARDRLSVALADLVITRLMIALG